MTSTVGRLGIESINGSPGTASNLTESYYSQPLFNLPESFERLPLEGAAKT